MASRRTMAASCLLGLVVAGCAAPGVTRTGSAHVVLPATRNIQYVSANIQALRVTITHQASRQDYVKTFPGSALVASPSGSQLGFVAENLMPGSYQAKVEAFLDQAATLSAGSASTTPFVVTAFQTTPVTLPHLKLAATPIGDWQLKIGVALHGGFMLSGYSSELSTPAGSTVEGPSGPSLPATSTFTWGNVPIFSTDLSTTSITITATNKKDRVITKTLVATASILADATISSSVSVVFP